MKLKIIACLLILAVAIGAGCSGQQVDTGEQANDTIPEQEEQNNETEVQVADPEVNDTPPGEPELKIMDVNVIDDQIEVNIKNIGNITAEDVYIGSLAFTVSNEKAYEEYVTREDFKIMSDAIRGGVTGDTYTYETNYSYKNTSNMTFYYWLDARSYMGDIPPKETRTRSMISRDYMPMDDVRQGTIAWIDGQEDEFVLY
jgi:hypothetical protein